MRRDDIMNALFELGKLVTTKEFYDELVKRGYDLSYATLRVYVHNFIKANRIKKVGKKIAYFTPLKPFETKVREDVEKLTELEIKDQLIWHKCFLLALLKNKNASKRIEELLNNDYNFKKMECDIHV